MYRVAIAVVSLLALQSGDRAWASGTDGPTAGAKAGNGNPVVYVSTPGTDPSGNAGGSGTVTCGLYAGDTTGVWIGAGDPVTAPVAGETYWISCSDSYVNRIVYDPANVIDPGTLARRAFNELPLIYPRPRTAPPATANQLVGVRTWLWVDPADWHPLSATAAIGGLSATVTATPTSTVWTMGDGTTITCDGPGTPYDPQRPDDEQSTQCSHTYQHDGPYTVLATIVWTVSWTSSTGAGGDLGTVQRSTQFPLTVEQRQAVITG